LEDHTVNWNATILCAALLAIAACAPAVAADIRNQGTAEPNVTPARAAARYEQQGDEASVTRARKLDRAQPENSERSVSVPRLSNRPEQHGQEQLVRSPAAAASIELVPDEAESRCVRIEGQMRCTPVTK
jgi:hypothetical protein